MIWFSLIYQSLELFKALQEQNAIQVTTILKQTIAVPLYIAHLICTYFLWRPPSQRSLDAANLALAVMWIWQITVQTELAEPCGFDDPFYLNFYHNYLNSR